MTTITSRFGIVAADTQASQWTMKYTDNLQKMVPHTGTKRLYAFTGHIDLFLPSVVWHLNGASIEETCPLVSTSDNSSSSLIVFTRLKESEKTGQIQVMEYNSLPYPQIRHFEYAAFGSGQQLALGAFYQGAVADEALKAAIKYDRGTGGAMNVFDIINFEWLKKPKKTLENYAACKEVSEIKING